MTIESTATTAFSDTAVRMLESFTLFLGDWSSTCGNCGMDAPGQKTCTTCGVSWKFSAITAGTCRSSDINREALHIEKHFPDYTFIGELDTRLGIFEPRFPSR